MELSLFLSLRMYWWCIEVFWTFKGTICSYFRVRKNVAATNRMMEWEEELWMVKAKVTIERRMASIFPTCIFISVSIYFSWHYHFLSDLNVYLYFSRSFVVFLLSFLFFVSCQFFFLTVWDILSFIR